MIPQKLFVALFITVLFTACKSKEDNSNQIATDMCGCFNKLKDSLPPESIEVFKKAAAAENAYTTFTKEIQGLPVEVALKVNAALLSTGKKGSSVNMCLEELDKKYKNTYEKNDTTAMRKMLNALKDKTGCDISIALLRINLDKGK
jgi:hypothetical protein